MPGFALAIDIVTGKWRVETELRNPMSSRPQFNSATECITEGSFDPARAMMQGGQCTITDRQDTANSVSWKFQCGGKEMPVSSGTGKFVSRGKTANGEIQMSMLLNGRKMTITNIWKGQHLGDECD
jgi:hypothetical protein